MFGKRFSRALAVTTVASLVMAAAAFASDVNVNSVVDVNAPTGSVSLAPGGSEDITINITVTGNQAGTATFYVYQDWTLTGGVFTGSNPKEFVVGPQSGGTTTNLSASGKVTVASGHVAGGPHTLTVGVFGLTNSNATGAKAEAKLTATYTVTVTAPPAPSDTTAPVITPSISGTLGVNGWYTSSVTVTFLVVDNESAISFKSAACDVQNEVNADTAGVTFTCTATSAGGTANESVTIKRDATAPTINGSASPAPNAAGWNNTDVVVTYDCDDNLSGVATCGPDETLSSEGSGLSSAGTVTDFAGNSATTTVAGINIDKTDPVVNVTGVSDGATYVLGSVPSPGCSTSDELSGVATYATLSTTGGPVGSITATCSGALDNAGNVGSASATYQVVFDFDGFFQPVDNMPAWNSAKAGQSIPLKFSLGGSQGLSILEGAPKLWKVSCPNASADVVPIFDSETSTANNGLTYDSLNDQYNYVWKTDKRLGGMCYQVDVNLIDGTTHSAWFAFKK